jgi:hypothetical protein
MGHRLHRLRGRLARASWTALKLSSSGELPRPAPFATSVTRALYLLDEEISISRFVAKLPETRFQLLARRS